VSYANISRRKRRLRSVRICNTPGYCYSRYSVGRPVRGDSIQDSKTASQVSQNEQAFTVADSRLSKARFSTSIFQEAPFKVQDGVVSVDGDDSYLQIDVFDRNTGAPIYLLDTSGRAIYTDSTLAHQVPMSYQVYLGTIKATSKDGKVIGYQGGGVWTLYPDGGCIVVTPPDFDYNGVTLTLPITHLNGESATGYTDSTSLINAESEVPRSLFIRRPLITARIYLQPGMFMMVQTGDPDHWFRQYFEPGEPDPAGSDRHGHHQVRFL